MSSETDEITRPNSNTLKYWAFISYSHADARWGDWLHKKIETYRVPRALVGKPSRDGAVPRRLYPVFRDREELPVSSDLGANLKNSLERSRYLIVICSPRAAKSYWVDEEVRHFKSLHGENRLLCLIVHGEPNAASKGDSDEKECFPPAVRFRVSPNGEIQTDRTEPIAADARPLGDGRHRAKLKLISGLLGVSFDDLWRRERRRRLYRTLQVLAVILGLTLLGVTGWQWESRRDSVAHFIEVGKKGLAEGRRLEAAAYFAKAWRAGGKSKGLEKLLRESSKALVEPAFILKDGHKDWVTFAKFVDGNHVITASWDKTIRLWDLNKGGSTLLRNESDKVASANFFPNDGRLVSALWDGNVNVWTPDGVLLARFDHGKRLRVNWAEFSPDGKRLLTASDDNVARIWDLEGKQDLKPLVLSGHDGWVKTAVFDSTGARVLTASLDTTAKIWDARTGSCLLTLGPHPNGVNAAVFSPDNVHVATACLDGSVLLWDTSKSNPTAQVFSKVHGHRTNSVSFNYDGSRLLTTGDDHTAKVWDVNTRELLLSFEQHHDVVVYAGFSPDGHRIVTASKDRTAMVFDVDLKVRTPDEIVALAEKLVPQTAASSEKVKDLAQK